MMERPDSGTISSLLEELMPAMVLGWRRQFDDDNAESLSPTTEQFMVLVFGPCHKTIHIVDVFGQQQWCRRELVVDIGKSKLVTNPAMVKKDVHLHDGL